VLSKAAQDLEFLEPAVAVVLGFIGAKMIAEYFGVVVSTSFSLAIVSGVLSTGVALSLWKKRQIEDTIN
jgi:predicted tellurium resistance membrane protein TerC